MAQQQQGFGYDDQVYDSFGIETGVTFGDVAEDIAMAIPRAAEGIVQATYNLGDALLMDALPDYDKRFLGQQNTIVGGLASGLLQFAVPFGYAVKGATTLSKLTRLQKLTGRVKNPLAKTALNYGKITAAGAATDMVVFNGLEGRMADMAREYGFENDFINWLSTDKDDTELEGRMKNALEGAILGVGVDTVVKLFKLGKKVLRGSKDPKTLEELAVSDELDEALSEYAAVTERLFMEQFGYTPQQARVGRVMIEQLGLDVDERFGGILTADQVEELAINNPDLDMTANGFTTVMDNGQIFIGALQNPNFSTGMHELAHVARSLFLDIDVDMGRRVGISDDMIEVAARESGAQWDEVDGRWVWDTEAEENFARMFERWLYGGEGVYRGAPEMDTVFASIASWMRNVYSTLTGSEIDIAVSDDMRRLFEAMTDRADLPSLEDARAAIDEPQLALPHTPQLALPAPAVPTFDGPMEQKTLFQKSKKKKEKDKPKLRPHQKKLIKERMTVPVQKESVNSAGGVSAFNGTNAQQVKASTDAVLKRFKNPFSSQKMFERFMSAYRAADAVVSFPRALVAEFRGNKMRERIDSLTPRQLAAVDAGLEKVAEVGGAVREDPEKLALVLFWSKLSAGISPYPQEAAFLDLTEEAMRHIGKARRGEFSEEEWLADVDKKLNKYSRDRSPGNSAKHNANGYALWLQRVSDSAQQGRDILRELHEVWFSDKDSVDVLYDYYDLIGGAGAGLDNKLLMFSRLVTGFEDVIVIDRLQEQSWWGLTEEMVDEFNAIIEEMGLPIEKKLGMGDLQAQIDGMMSGADGLVFYRALMRFLNERLPDLYEGTGRTPTLGRWHWETWLSAGEESEVAHETLDFFLKGSKYDGAIAETRFGKFEYDVKYGPRPGDRWRLIASPIGGSRILLTGDEWAEVSSLAKRQGKVKMFPQGFSIEKYAKENGRPWHEADGVYPEYLKLLAAKVSGKELVRDGDGFVGERYFTEAERNEIDLAFRQLATGIRVRRWRAGRSPDEGANAFARTTATRPGDAGSDGVDLTKDNKKSIAALEKQGVKIRTTFVPEKSWKNALGDSGHEANIGRTLVHELDVSDPATAEFAADIMRRAAANKNNWAVEAKSAEQLAEHRVFVSEDGQAMIALDGPDMNNMTALCKTSECEIRAVAHNLLRVAIEEGGRKGDCFDGLLPMMYAAHGAVPVQRVTFDPQFAPARMPKDEQAEAPDIVHFVIQPDADLVYMPSRDKEIGARAKSYDDAVRITDNEVVRQERRVMESKGVLLYQRSNEIPPPPQPGSREARLLDRSPALQAAARALRDGEITRQEYDQVRQQAKPVEPYTRAPMPTPTAQMRSALKAGQVEKIGASAQIADGAPVQLRLDIPAYTRHKAWVVTTHEGGKKAGVGRALSYDSVARIDDVEFDVGTPRTQEVTRDIATGERSKFPMATMRGKHRAITPEDAKDLADRVLAGEETGWTQVGFDPSRHGYFYTRDTVQPVLSADEVVQIGPLVLARNAKLGDKAEFLYQKNKRDPRFENRRRVPRDPDEILNADRIATDLDLGNAVHSLVRNVLERARSARKTLVEQREDAETAITELQYMLGSQAVTEDMINAIRNGDLDGRIEQISAELTALREAMASLGTQLKVKLEKAYDPKAKGFVGTDKELAELLRHNMLIQALAFEIKRTQTGIARALGAQRIRPTGTTPVRLPEIDMDDEMVDLMLRKSGGRKRAQKKLKQQLDILRLDTNADGRVNPSKMDVERLPLLPEYFINNILSGPITHAVNMVGNAMVNIWDPIEKAMGSLLTRNMQGAYRDLAELASTPLDLMDAARIAAYSFREDAPILTGQEALRDVVGGGDSPRRAWSAAGQMKDPDSLQGMFFDHVGKVVNVPSRLLLTQDEFFKQLAYRRIMRRRLMEVAAQRFPDAPSRARFIAQQQKLIASENMQYTKESLYSKGLAEADANGLTGNDAHQYAENFVAGNWDSQLGKAAEDAVQESRRLTWQNEPNIGDREFKGLSQRLGFGRGLRGMIGGMSMDYQMFARRNPLLQFLTPFVRTPTNILQYFLDRSFGAVSDNLALLIDDIRGQAVSQEARRDIRGRLATGVVFTGLAAYYATSTDENGLPLLTGKGPDDPDERERYEALGWQPYSVRVGDKYISYRRLDPFATFLSTVADVIQKSSREESLGQSPNYLLNAAVAIFNNVADKSYLTGMSSFFSMLDKGPDGVDFDQIMKQYARAMAPASSFMTQAVTPYLNDDRYLLEVRNAHDAFIRALPGGPNMIERKRNIFGEFREVPRGIGPDFMSPLRYTEVKDDALAREMAAIGFRSGPPHEKVMRSAPVDWSTYENDKGQSAYDRFLELHGEVKIQGMTMKQAMQRLIKTKGYRALSAIGDDDLPSPRVKELQRVLSLFRSRAKEQTLREYPELAHDVQAFMYNRAVQQQGGTPEQFIELINRR